MADKAVGVTIIKLRGLKGLITTKNTNLSLGSDVVGLSLLSLLFLFLSPFPLLLYRRRRGYLDSVYYRY